MSTTTDKKAIESLHLGMDEASSLAEFITQYEALTNSQVTGAVESLSKIKMFMYDAIVAIAAGTNR